MLDERQIATIQLQVRLSGQIDEAYSQAKTAAQYGDTRAYLTAIDRFRVAVKNYNSFILLAEPSALTKRDRERWLDPEEPLMYAYPQPEFMYQSEDVPF